METKKLKGKDTFTKAEIEKLRELIRQRVAPLSASDGSKKYRDKRLRDEMRDLGFYGGHDWGIRDMQEADLDQLIKDKRIKIQ